MRRPSRLGLIPVCSSQAADGLRGAPETFSEKDHFSSAFVYSYFIVIFFLACSVSDAQNLKEELKNYYREIRQGKYPSIPLAISASPDEKEILSILQPYLKDSSRSIRAKAHEMVHQVSVHSPNSDFRTRSIDILVSACGGRDVATRTINLNLLESFDKKDFSVSSKDTLRKLIQSTAEPFDELIKVAAFLEMEDLSSIIRSFSLPGNRPQTRWAALLSLSRMNDRGAVSELVNLIRKLPTNDDVVYEVFPGLIYTRRPEAISFLVEALKSNEKNCATADAEKEMPIPCAYRIMELLSPVIQGFPLELDDSGDLKANDYSKALETVREWFQINKTYTILNNRY